MDNVRFTYLGTPLTNWNLLLRDKSKEIIRVKSHGIDLITSGYICLCGHTLFISDKVTEFSFLSGNVFIEDISCMKCQRIFKMERKVNQYGFFEI